MVQTGSSPIFAGLCAGSLNINGNFAATPTFAPGGFSLASTSAGVDRGFNDYTTLAFDFSGNRRMVDGDDDGTATVDVGAFEFQNGNFASGFE
jgi:hypothetical protein